MTWQNFCFVDTRERVGRACGHPCTRLGSHRHHRSSRPGTAGTADLDRKARAHTTQRCVVPRLVARSLKQVDDTKRAQACDTPAPYPGWIGCRQRCGTHRLRRAARFYRLRLPIAGHDRPSASFPDRHDPVTKGFALQAPAMLQAQVCARPCEPQPVRRSTAGQGMSAAPGAVCYCSNR